MKEAGFYILKMLAYYAISLSSVRPFNFVFTTPSKPLDGF
jgi:hypothetical protein